MGGAGRDDTAAGNASDRPEVTGLGSPWAGGAVSFAAPLAMSAGRVRGSGGERLGDALLLNEPQLLHVGPAAGMSRGGTGGRS